MDSPKPSYPRSIFHLVRGATKVRLKDTSRTWMADVLQGYGIPHNFQLLSENYFKKKIIVVEKKGVSKESITGLASLDYWLRTATERTVHHQSNLKLIWPKYVQDAYRRPSMLSSLSWLTFCTRPSCDSTHSYAVQVSMPNTTQHASSNLRYIRPILQMNQSEGQRLAPTLIATKEWSRGVPAWRPVRNPISCSTRCNVHPRTWLALEDWLRR